MKKSILHVDDSNLILQLVNKKLTKEGYIVHSLATPENAIDILMDTDIRVCILDIKMPKIDGLELLQKIKQFDGGIQGIMLTGEVSQSTILESHRLGAEACFFKPIQDFQPLLVSLDRAFEKLDRWWNSLEELNSIQHNQSA